MFRNFILGMLVAAAVLALDAATHAKADDMAPGGYADVGPLMPDTTHGSGWKIPPSFPVIDTGLTGSRVPGDIVVFRGAIINPMSWEANHPGAFLANCHRDQYLPQVECDVHRM